ncbi:MAG: ferredoxin [Acidimicrobiales bacterium]
MRVTVDPDVCQGHTLCALAAPEVFLLREDDGHAFVAGSEVPPAMEEAVRKAAATCPEGAISLEE